MPRILPRFHAPQQLHDAAALLDHVDTPAVPALCTLTDSGHINLRQLSEQLQRTAINKNMQMPSVLSAILVCERVGSDVEGNTCRHFFAVNNDTDVPALKEKDKLHILWPDASADTFFSAYSSLSPLSATFVAAGVKPKKNQADQRLAELDCVNTQCSVPRSPSEEAMPTDAIIAAASSSDPSTRVAIGHKMLSAFRECGFLRLRFSLEELQLIRDLDQMQRAFFAQPRELKDPSFDPNSNGKAIKSSSDNYQKASGYSSSHACRKEFFVVRQRPQPAQDGVPENAATAAASSSNAAALSSVDATVASIDQWSLPSSPASFSPSVWAVFHRLGLICRHLTFLLLESLGAAPQRIEDLLKDCMRAGRNDEENRFTSVIELFHYSVKGTATATAAAAADLSSSSPLPCSMHSDASLLTLIPRCTGSPGLQVYNWAAVDWQAVECQSSEDEGIIFPGDMLQRVSNGMIIASPHRVAFDPTTSSSSASSTGSEQFSEDGQQAERTSQTSAAASSSMFDNNASFAPATSAAGPPLSDLSHRYSFPFELFLAPRTIVDVATLFPSLSVAGGGVSAQVRDDCRPVVSAMEALSEISRNLVSVNKTN